MSSKFPWVAATIIIVAAAGLGAWALSTPATPTQGTATVTGVSSGPYAFGLIGENSGIENIYIITSNLTGQTKYLDNENLKGDSDVLGTITYSGQSVNIAYETAFDIVVTVKGRSPDNMAYARKENLQTELTVSGSFAIAAENSQDTASSAQASENLITGNGGSENLNTTAGWVRINCIWDNANAGYKLPAGGNISITAKLFCWK